MPRYADPLPAQPGREVMGYGFYHRAQVVIHLLPDFDVRTSMVGHVSK